MKYIIALLIVVLGTAININAQHYDYPPKLAFINDSQTGKITVALLSTHAHGTLSYGDTLGFKIHNTPELIYAYGRREVVKIEEIYETMFLPASRLDSLRAGGVQYIRINQEYYGYNYVQRKLHIQQALKLNK